MSRAVAAVGDPEARLYPDEQALVAGAVPRRVAIFAAGRLAARRALAAAGCARADGPILREGFGAPKPPAGWRLSISHVDTVAVAVACPDHAAAGLGVDIERLDGMRRELARYVVGPGDRLPHDYDAVHLATVFSVREAVYKALSAAAQAALDRIEIGLADADIRVRTVPTAVDMLAAFRIVDGHVVSLCVRPA